MGAACGRKEDPVKEPRSILLFRRGPRLSMAKEAERRNPANEVYGREEKKYFIIFMINNEMIDTNEVEC